MYVYLTDTIHENTYKMEELLHDKKRKQNIYKKAVAEALSLGTGGSAGTPCNLLFWWLPSHCHISDFLFQMSWVTRNQNKAYLISYTVFSLVNLDLKDPSFFLFRSFNGDSQPMLLGMGPCQLPRGHWQCASPVDTGRWQYCSSVASFLLFWGPQAVFSQQLLCPQVSPQLSPGSTPLSVL